MSIDALQTRIRKLKNPTMLGLDPTQDIIPPQILSESFEKYGTTPKGLAEAGYTFCHALLQELKDFIPAVKLQSACFFALGADGIAVMQRLLQDAADMGYYVVMDLMRNDVPHTAELSAASVFHGIRIGEETFQPYVCDAVTLGAYTGSDGIQPYLPYCKGGAKNIFLLVKTSNKSSREVQDLLSGDRVIYTAMADLAMRWSNQDFGKYGYSEVAITAGATFPDALKKLRDKYDRLFLLVSGYGAQGGSAKHVQYAFDRMGHGAIVCASRSIISAWKREGETAENYCAAARRAAEKMKKEILKYVEIV